MKDIDYIKFLWRKETEFIQQSKEDIIENYSNNLVNNSNGILRLSTNAVIGILDFCLLLSVLFFTFVLRRPKLNLLFLSNSFCFDKSGTCELRIGREIIPKSTVFINSSKELIINRIGSQKVYNIGLLIKVVSVIWCRETDIVAKNYKAYRFINNGILLFRSCFDRIYFYCHYDLNAFSLIFSKYRGDLTLVEIQHGSMINYPVYSIPSTIKVADIFYVRNLATIEYLKTHINKNFICDYKLLKYPVEAKVIKRGLNILYASSLEMNGFHSVFKQFIRSSTSATLGEINLSIRLHPREKGKEHLFTEELKGYTVNYKFDNSDNWLIANAIQDLIVVSPWSSIIEEAVDNNYTTIIIDKTGRLRYSQLINNLNCFYSENLNNILNENWLRKKEK